LTEASRVPQSSASSICSSSCRSSEGRNAHCVTAVIGPPGPKTGAQFLSSFGGHGWPRRFPRLRSFPSLCRGELPRPVQCLVDEGKQPQPGALGHPSAAPSAKLRAESGPRLPTCAARLLPNAIQRSRSLSKIALRCGSMADCLERSQSAAFSHGST
jgi:hypothetical protein